MWNKRQHHSLKSCHTSSSLAKRFQFSKSAAKECRRGNKERKQARSRGPEKQNITKLEHKLAFVALYESNKTKQKTRSTPKFQQGRFFVLQPSRTTLSPNEKKKQSSNLKMPKTTGIQVRQRAQKPRRPVQTEKERGPGSPNFVSWG